MSTGLKANSDGSAAIQVGGTDVITLTSSGAATFVTSPTTVQAGTAAAPSITTSGDTNTGIFFPAADTIAFAEGGVESMRIDSAGNVGIGTSSPTTKLDVSGQVTTRGSVAAFVAEPRDGTGATWSIYNPTGDDLRFFGNSDDRMILTNSGNLGLGVTPSAWGSTAKALQVGSVGTIENFNNINFNIGTNYYRNTSGTLVYTTSSRSVAYSQDISNGAHAWFTAPSGTAGNAITFTQAMTLDASGKLGVGTTSPSSYGSSNLAVVGGELAISNTSEARLYLYTGTTASGLVYADSGRMQIEALRSSPLVFWTNAAERARIDSSGKFMVGLTNGTGTINSTASVTISSTNAISGMAFVASGGYGGGVSIIDGTQGYSLWSQTSGADFYIRRSTTTGTYTGGVYISNAAGSWSSASDERLKNIIRPINNAVEKIKDYRCVIGEYKDNPGAERPFLIAQDVQATFPEAVNVMDTENGYLGLSYTEIIPLLTKAIQEQQALITDLQTRLAALEGAA